MLKQSDNRITSFLRENEGRFVKQEFLAGFVRLWCKSNSIPPHAVNRALTCSAVLDEQPSDYLFHKMALSLGSLELKGLENAFAGLLEKDAQKLQGVVYTPNYIIDFLLRKSLTLSGRRNPPRLLDPACGSAGFLIRGVEIIAQQYGLEKEKVLRECVFGADVAPEAIEYAKIVIELYCLQQRLPPPQAWSFLQQTDFLLAERQQLWENFGVTAEGFDLIVTNPPYVKFQNLDESYRAGLYRRYPQFTQGTFSLSSLFLIAGHRALAENGVLGLITQNNLFTSLAGESVREYLQAERCLNAIIDFGHHKVFSAASAYTCLLFLSKQKKESFNYAACPEPEARLPLLAGQDYAKINTATLNKKKWRLAAKVHLENLARLESQGAPLGRLAEIKVGFATLKDKVFLVSDEVMRQCGIETEITRPAIKVTNFRSAEDLRDNKTRVIHPYQKIAGRWLPLAESELKACYPNAYNYLAGHREELAQRDKGKKPPAHFYEWSRTQGMDAPGPKLLTKTFSKGPNFILDESDSLFCNGYSVRPRAKDGLFAEPATDMRLLQKILNSCVMDYYAKLTAFQLEGDYQCFQKNFIERFCLPTITETQAQLLYELLGEDLELLCCEIFGLDKRQVDEIIRR